MIRHAASQNRNVEVRPNPNAFLQRGRSAWPINSAEREGGIVALQAIGFSHLCLEGLPGKAIP